MIKWQCPSYDNYVIASAVNLNLYIVLGTNCKIKTHVQVGFCINDITSSIMKINIIKMMPQKGQEYHVNGNILVQHISSGSLYILITKYYFL